MRRSNITSLFGLISLIMQIFSYFLTLSIDSTIAIVSLAIGIPSVVFLLIPSIFLAHYEVRSPTRESEVYEKKIWGNFTIKMYSSRFEFSEHPLGALFSSFYGIFFLLSGLFIGPLMIEKWPLVRNPILGMTLIILWILCGILGIMGAILYRDPRSPNKHAPKGIIWQEP